MTEIKVKITINEKDYGGIRSYSDQISKDFIVNDIKEFAEICIKEAIGE